VQRTMCARKILRADFLLYFFIFANAVRRFTKEAPLSLFELSSFEGRHFKRTEESTKFLSLDPDCPALFSNYRADSMDQHTVYGLRSAPAAESAVHQHECTGHFGGLDWYMEDQHLVFENGLIGRISMDQQILRMENDTEAPAYLQFGDSKHRDWDSEVDEGYKRIMQGQKCQSENEYLGNFATSGLCAEGVLNAGYDYFMFGHNNTETEGECYISHTDSEYCREGWQPAKFDFFAMVSPLNSELVSFIHTTYASKMRAAGYEEEALAAEEKLGAILHRRTQRRSLQTLAAENEEESGGRSAACGRSHKRTECLETFAVGVDVVLNIFGRAQTPVCKKSKDKRARSHPSCCGGKQAWYCLGICCKGGGTLSCCGANWGWTVHPVIDRYCYADQGSFPYVEGSDVCPPNFHSCSVWMGQGGVACASSVTSCLVEKFRAVIKVLEVVVNCVLLVLSFGEYYALETSLRVAIETGAEAAARATGKSAARKAMMRAWKIAGIGFDAFKHVLWDELKELPAELAELVLEESMTIMMAKSAEADAPDAGQIAWDIAEVVDPTGIASLVNYIINGLEWCVYPEHFSPYDQKKLVVLTHQADIIDRFSALYGAGECSGVIGAAQVSEIDCESLHGNIIEGRMVAYAGLGPMDNGLNNCGCNFVNYDPVTQLGMNQVYYGGENCKIKGGETPQQNTPICEFTRDCDGDNYIAYSGYECALHRMRSVSPPIIDNCLAQCKNSTLCTAFHVRADSGSRQCYLTEGRCDLQRADSQKEPLYVRELCSQNKYILDDEEGPKWCTAAQTMTEAECMGLHDKRLASDILVEWGRADTWDVSTGVACGCFLTLIQDTKWQANYNHRSTNCDMRGQEIPVCRKEKDRCYEVGPEDSVFSGPYVQKNTTLDRPIFCRQDGNYSLHYDIHDHRWNLCEHHVKSCDWLPNCFGGNSNATVEEAYLRPKPGELHGIHPSKPFTIEELECRDVQRPMHSLSDYWATSPGLLCPTAMHVIRTKGECATALRQLKWNSTGFHDFHNSYFPYDDGDAFPAGCSSRGGAATPMFERSTAGRGKAVKGVMQICKRPKYYMGSFEDGSCPNFASMIYDKNECMDALEILGIPIYFAADAKGSPNGCSYDLGETAAYFTQSQAEDGMGKSQNGRAPICREVRCLKSSGNARIPGKPWNSTQFDATDPNFADWGTLCEQECLSNEQCACFQMIRPSGMCFLYTYFDCYNAEPIVTNPEDEADQNFVHGFCPHAGAVGFLPITTASCLCPYYIAEMSGPSFYDYDCAKEIYKARDAGYGIDELYAQDAFFMHYTKTATQDPYYSAEYNCLLVFANDRTCQDCSMHGFKLPVEIDPNYPLEGGLIPWEANHQNQVVGKYRYVFNQMAGGFFDNFYVHECECEDYCRDPDNVGFSWCYLKGGLRAKHCPGAIMATTRDKYWSGATCDHDYPCECLGSGFGGYCKDWDQTGYNWCYLKGGDNARHCPEARKEELNNGNDKKTGQMWWSGAPCYEHFCQCEDQCSEADDTQGATKVSLCTLKEFDSDVSLEHCKGAKSSSGGKYTSGYSCGNGLTEIDYFIGEPGTECMRAMAIESRIECEWAMKALDLPEPHIKMDYPGGKSSVPCGCSYRRSHVFCDHPNCLNNPDVGQFNECQLGTTPEPDYSPICKRIGRGHYYFSELNGNCASAAEFVMTESECKFALGELGVWQPITITGDSPSSGEGYPAGCSWRPTGETCDDPKCVSDPNRVSFMKGIGHAKSPSLRQVCKRLGCVPCKCNGYNEELEIWYDCHDASRADKYGPISCYDPAQNEGKWIPRAYSPECPKSSATLGTPSASTSEKHYDNFDSIKLTMKRDTELTIKGDNLEMTIVAQVDPEYQGDETTIELALDNGEKDGSEVLVESIIYNDLSKSRTMLRLFVVIGLSSLFFGGIYKFCFRETEYKQIH